mmetsp:Transcript_29355/g.79471  ORF Transcript_29355/g.79471 Transcript_29355/m.79471 type:complete len:177 (+) Transcript_29355:365-895(+)
MRTYRMLLFFLSSQILFSCYHKASAFLTISTTGTTVSMSTSASWSTFSSQTSPSNSDESFFVLHAGFEQLPGESNTDFIKRITSQSGDFMNQQKSKTNKLTMPSSRKKLSSKAAVGDDEEKEKPKPKGKYQPIEEWDAERKAKGELSWEEKVQFDGQRFGNQVKQDSILRRHLGTF